MLLFMVYTAGNFIECHQTYHALFLQIGAQIRQAGASTARCITYVRILRGALKTQPLKISMDLDDAFPTSASAFRSDVLLVRADPPCRATSITASRPASPLIFHEPFRSRWVGGALPRRPTIKKYFPKTTLISQNKT